MATWQNTVFFWIGGSDSRVPANVIAGLDPGGVFVHRNMANVIHGAVMNFLSALEFAVDTLRIREIIACGQYGCGGVRAATEDMARAAELFRPDADLLDLLHVPESFHRVNAALAQLSSRVDRIVTTGGVSVRAADFVLPAPESLGASTIFSGVAIRADPSRCRADPGRRSGRIPSFPAAMRRIPDAHRLCDGPGAG